MRQRNARERHRFPAFFVGAGVVRNPGRKCPSDKEKAIRLTSSSEGCFFAGVFYNPGIL